MDQITVGTSPDRPGYPDLPAGTEYYVVSHDGGQWTVNVRDDPAFAVAAAAREKAAAARAAVAGMSATSAARIAARANADGLDLIADYLATIPET